jgi:hypothetical protein
MTLYIDLPTAVVSKREQLTGQFGAEILPAQPNGLDEVPAGKALVCVGDMGSYEAAGYILTEGEFASWTDPADRKPKVWLLMDREIADELCPDAAGHRQVWQSVMARDAEAASHPDNLIPVARASRSGLRFAAETLRKHASALRGDPRGTAYDRVADPQRQRIVAADLDAAAHDLESWIERDWIAIIDFGPERQSLEGPLPPFPGHQEQ